MTFEIISPHWQDYALLDSGGGRKLERFGQYALVRPEPRAEWNPTLPASTWEAADAEYIPAEKGGGGRWRTKPGLPDRWQIGYRQLRIWVELEASRQVGVFPENAAQWDWIADKLKGAQGEVRVLNLFGYTGLASLAAAHAGASVTHIDSSRRAIRLGRDDQTLSGLDDLTIRWIAEDAVKFAEREVRRGNRYHGIIFDPPKYGLGPKKERWSFFEHFAHLCQVLRDCLEERPLFVVVTAYALESPPEVLRLGLEAMLAGFDGTLTLGELVAEEQSGKRRLHLSVTGRWESSLDR
ncbi:MAG TPA: class I SAM-dependent methyltransferase [Anaerolineales bacterium]|nr:class I SAM-dependent methyltransferase [Anaerolineales bacterium]